MRISAILVIFAKLCAAQDNAKKGAICGEVPMTQWTGQASLRTDVLPNPVGLVIIQHSVFAPCATDTECQNVTKLIRSYQMNKLGFTDIGPSFLVGGNGKVYEGAGWSLIGAHTKGYNHRSIGVSFLGDFRETLPSPAALQAAKDLISCGASRGFLTQEYQLVGHMQVSTTESPGAVLQSEIQTWPHWGEAHG